jgi:type IV pilus biogenesis protein CpaD/CtpE
MIVRNATLVLIAAMGLSACVEANEPLQSGFGDAYHHNIAVQVINPQPENAGSGAPNLDGDRAGLAIERYKSAKTLEPVVVTTSGVGGTE